MTCDSFDPPKIYLPTIKAAPSYAVSSLGSRNWSKDKQLAFLWSLLATASSCFQTLPFLFDTKLGRMNSPSSQRSVILVISPLACLIVNQVSQLRSVGVSAAILSGNNAVDLDKRLQAVDTEPSTALFTTLPSSIYNRCYRFTMQGLYTP